MDEIRMINVSLRIYIHRIARGSRSFGSRITRASRDLKRYRYTQFFDTRSGEYVKKKFALPRILSTFRWNFQKLSSFNLKFDIPPPEEVNQIPSKFLLLQRNCAEGLDPFLVQFSTLLYRIYPHKIHHLFRFIIRHRFNHLPLNPSHPIY